MRFLPVQIFFAFVALMMPAAASAADTRLPDAAMQGDFAAVQALLKQNVDVNVPQGDGTTALHWAVHRDDLVMAQVLLKAGANIKAKTRIGEITPLFMAAQNGNAALIDILLKSGAEPNAANTVGTTPLMMAAASGENNAVKLLLDRGADVNAKDSTNGQTALMFASALNRAAVIKMLVDRGADMNVTSRVLESAQAGGQQAARRNRGGQFLGGLTALHFAAREGQAEAVRALVAAGADTNQVAASDRMSVMTQAIINGHFDIAKFLLDHGSDPKLASTGGLTPLFATIDQQ